MERHFVDHIEAFGSGYADPKEVLGRYLPADEVRQPHECVPGICETGRGRNGGSGGKNRLFDPKLVDVE
ncbi:hypothetical protein AB0I28_23090 [Phytomonospora sp. NPDC050363]|uniref:hypothetical protein n=1 Tax=Phytomonospora sp. NPDC050363 TaxID=3155642 RepID=UPI00340F4958